MTDTAANYVDDPVVRRHAAELGAPADAPPTLPRERVTANRAAWLAALRSGRFEQCHGALRSAVDRDDEPRAYGYCCLGVAEDARGACWNAGHSVVAPDVALTYTAPGELTRRLTDIKTNGSVLSGWGQVWLGVTDSDPSVAIDDEDSGGWSVVSLTTLNDDYDWSFARIADAVEDQGVDWDGSFRQADRLAAERAQARANTEDAKDAEL